MLSDWRTKDISRIGLEFDTSRVYLLACRPVGIKGWLGGRHSYLYCFSESRQTWVSVEITDIETLQIQKSNIHVQLTDEFLQMAPFITDRPADQKWFGAAPRIVDSLELRLDIDELEKMILDYPFSDYKVMWRNCNTFSSYINYHLHSKYDQSFSAPYFVGFKSKKWWSGFYQRSYSGIYAYYRDIL